MIYEFALEPELVASWADRGAYRFFDGKFGIGGRRIASAFPAHDKWRAMVLRAVEDTFQHTEPPERPCGQCAKRQAALQRVDVLLGHLRKDMAVRAGTMRAGWREAVILEHADRNFQGILAASRPRPVPPIIAAEDIDESSAAWNPPARATARKVPDVVRTLEPLLRFATEVRFVDPYLDASLAEFFDPLAGLVRVAQDRRNPTAVKFEIHTSAKRQRATGQSRRHEDIARELFDDCKRLATVLKRGTSLRLFVWSEAVVGAEKIHNRYILTDVGGVGVPAGLDRAHPTQAHTDDLFVLSREQHELRWAQYREGSRRLKCVLGPEVVVGTG